MINRISIVCLIILSSVIPTSAQQEVKLLGVEIDGNKLASETMIRYTAGLRQNEVINVADFSRAVKRLWQLGLFNDVQINIDKETSDGFFITIQVQETPILGTVHYKGNKKLKDKQFQDELEFYTGQRIKPHELVESITKLKDFYAEDGFLLAEIEARLVDPDNKIDDKISDKEKRKYDLTKDILFTITENDKVKINKIRFQGNESYSGFRLRRVLKETKQQRWYLFWRSYFDGKKFDEDKLALEKFYRNNGYRDFTILSDSVYYEPKKRGLIVHLNVDEGKKYKYRNFTWEGNTLYETEILDRTLNLKSGDEFSQSGFDKAVFEEVQSLYMDRGYLYSNIQPFFTPVGEDSLDIHFSITENNQVYIRNINIYGNEKTRENVIRRELDVFPGDLFRRTLLQRSMRKLHVLNYFDPTSLSPNVIPVDEDEIDLDITLEEKSSDKASANVGFTGIYGMTGGGSVAFNNFLGKGQVLSFGFDIGTQMSVYNTYGTPAKYGMRELSK